METLNQPIYAALLGGALLTVQIILMLSVGMYRTSVKKGVGVDGDMKLERLVRRHGNLAENTAIFIVVLALYELLFGQTGLAFWTALLFAVARSMHIIGFSSNAGSHLADAESAGRIFVIMRASGAGLTAISSAALAIALLISTLTASPFELF